MVFRTALNRRLKDTRTALAERRESHDSIRQILRDATLRAAEADALRATPTANDERDELLGDAPGAGGAGSKPDKPTDEAGVMGLADDATAGLRRARAMMAEELDKGRRTLAAMADSRAMMKKTGDEYAGDQASALGSLEEALRLLEQTFAFGRLAPAAPPQVEHHERHDAGRLVGVAGALAGEAGRVLAGAEHEDAGRWHGKRRRRRRLG